MASFFTLKVRTVLAKNSRGNSAFVENYYCASPWAALDWADQKIRDTPKLDEWLRKFDTTHLYVEGEDDVRIIWFSWNTTNEA